MIKPLELFLPPEEAQSENHLLHAASQKLGLPSSRITHIEIAKKSFDARGKLVKVRFLLDVFIDEEYKEEIIDFGFKDVRNSEPVVIAGMGPAGMFAALKLIELGIKPIIIERGKDVKERRRDLAAINKQLLINPDSNYCFGEGGAGTYSDGKLYTRSNKRGDVKRILKLFVSHGAASNILYEAHPHIGTNKLPQIVTAMRETILHYGGEILFNTRLLSIESNGENLQAIHTHNNLRIQTRALILATGHSARDIFELLHSHNILIEAKPLAIGVRVEHPQQLIDSIQYHCRVRNPWLPPSAYSLVQQVQGKGVFSFCMCPGGIIAPAATAPGEVVVNGWSPSKRNGKFANSGIVVSIEEKDYTKTYKNQGPLAALRYQQAIEQACYVAANNSIKAPAQRLADYTKGITSTNLPANSYLPGLTNCNLADVLPPEINARLQMGFVEFGKKMKGYLTNEALVVATESRTSSPVRIPRQADTLEHVQLKGLFPCGEGAGYAGGIVSAAMDGERVADAVCLKLKSTKK